MKDTLTRADIALLQYFKFEAGSLTEDVWYGTDNKGRKWQAVEDDTAPELQWYKLEHPDEKGFRINAGVLSREEFYNLFGKKKEMCNVGC